MFFRMSAVRLDGRIAGSLETIERMIERNPKRQDEAKLPCHWVEEQGFEVTPKQAPPLESPSVSETAFLRKEKAAERPFGLPAP